MKRRLPKFILWTVPTLLVWRFLPKFPRGHCRRCGYNLKGLTEPRCPECGESFKHK
jgi:predicted amidophosphoribosyltransferase